MKNKKIIISIVFIIAAIVLILVASFIMSTSKNEISQKKISDYECLKKGNECNFNQIYKGIEVDVEVAKGKTYRFNVIKNTKNKMTLMMQENITEKVDWDIAAFNIRGPVAALKDLLEKTENWNKIDNILVYEYNDAGRTTYEKTCLLDNASLKYDCENQEHKYRGYNNITIKDGNLKINFNTDPNEIDYYPEETKKESEYENVKARLITKEELENTMQKGKLPAWLVKNLDDNEGYWTLTSSTEKPAKYVKQAVGIINENGSKLKSLYINNNGKYTIGIRPVIEIKKK